MKQTFIVFVMIHFSCPLISQNPDSSIAEKQIDSLIDATNALIRKNDLFKALESILNAETIALEKFGKLSRIYAACSYNKGRVYAAKNDFPAAENCFIDSKTIQEKLLGRENPDYAGSVHSLALLYKNMGNYPKAEDLYLESKEIYEVIFGREHPDYARSLNNIALFYKSIGNYEKAEPLYLESKAIREKISGKDHPDYAMSIHNLALLYQDLGNYEKSELLNLESKAIRERLLGKDHKDYAASIHNLAILYQLIGNSEKSEDLAVESKDLWEKLLGKSHPNYAASLNNLAHLYRHLGQFEKAETLFLESIQLSSKVLGKEHLEFAAGLNNLAMLYMATGQYGKADSLFLETKEILLKSLGKENRYYPGCIIRMAELYQLQGRYKEAEAFFLEAYDIRTRIFGKEHPDYVNGLGLMANFYMSRGDLDKAESFIIESVSLNQSLIGKAVNYLSDRELSNYLREFTKGQNNLLNFTRQRVADKLVSACFDNALFYKGFLLNSTESIKRLALSNPDAKEKFNQLKAVERKLAVEYSKIKSEQSGISTLENQVNDLEKELARTVDGYGEIMRQVNWIDVFNSLEKHEMAIEFIHFKNNISSSRENKEDSIHYAAVVLSKDAPRPEFIYLFEEKKLHELLNSMQDGKSIAPVYASRGANPLRSGGVEKGLYELIWKPIESHLKNTKKIYYSPAGLLHRLNFEAIPIGKTYMSDHYDLVRLSSTRSLVLKDAGRNVLSNNALLLGGIQYELDTNSMNTDNVLKGGNVTASSDLISFAFADRSISSTGEKWNYLPGTATEVAEINRIFIKAEISSMVYQGMDATEENFKIYGHSEQSPKILHIATHGFFFPDPRQVGKNEMYGGFRETSSFRMSDHPMIRSGLLLSGANFGWQTGKPHTGFKEDGILTAYEISQMNLANTELVVLSACETGLGDIQGNEGVYGLQRAFKIAGVKYLIMSLWQVPDQQTSLLMTAFYKKWLQEKKSIPAAFHAAQKDMRDKGLDPYQWAGFVLVE